MRLARFIPKLSPSAININSISPNPNDSNWNFITHFRIEKRNGKDNKFCSQAS
jgi:hypothetical protein